MRPKQIARALMPDPAYRLYRRRRIRRQIALYRPRIVEHTYAGQVLRIHLQDPLAEGWYDHDWALPPELEALALTESDLVFDLGAHQGVVACIAAQRARLVIAVEAEPHNARVARQNVRENDIRNVVVVHAAVADCSGSVLFAEGLNGHVARGSRVGKVVVPAVMIDELAARYGIPDAILIDIEGFEAHALRGAEQTLRGKTRFVVEVHTGCGLEDRGSTASDVIEQFTRHTLRTYPLDRDTGWSDATDLTERAFLFASPRAQV